jgi:predicted RNA-binding protein with PIN domain
MALLIDGYNLLHATDIFGRPGDGTELHRTRLALLNYLATAFNERERAEMTIVFDAAGAPPGLPRTLDHERITVHFSRGYADADAMLEELIEQHHAPRSLLVVSSDHRVQRAARTHGASSIDSDRWHAELRAARRASGATIHDIPAKPLANPTPDQVAYWLEKFAEPLPPEKEGRFIRRPSKTAIDDQYGTGKKAGKPRGDQSARKPVDHELESPFPPGYADDLLDGKE